MRRDFVSSSNIRSIGYDANSQTLEVEFTNSFVYQYYNVSQQVFDALMVAPSKGQFLNSHKKNISFSPVQKNKGPKKKTTPPPGKRGKGKGGENPQLIF